MLRAQRPEGSIPAQRNVNPPPDALDRSGYRLPTEPGMGIFVPRLVPDTSRRVYTGRAWSCWPPTPGIRNRPPTVSGPVGAFFPMTWACLTCWETCSNGARDARARISTRSSWKPEDDDIKSEEAVSELRELRGRAFTYPPSHLRSAIRRRIRAGEP